MDAKPEVVTMERWSELQEKVQRAAEQEKYNWASILTLLEKQSAELSALDNGLGENIFNLNIPDNMPCLPALR